MVSYVSTSSAQGAEAVPVQVEVQSSEKGQQSFRIVGLGDNAVQESRERITAALHASGMRLPKRVVVNLAPAAERKEGASFDLPIALGIAAAARGLRRSPIGDHCVVGELSLSGSVQASRGTLLHALSASSRGKTCFLGPRLPAELLPLMGETEAYRAKNLHEAFAIFSGEKSASPELDTLSAEPPGRARAFEGVIGQEQAKLALIIAAAGRHNMLMLGPPGAGKSLLASHLPRLLPVLSPKELRECLMIHGASEADLGALLAGQAPFRAPHHSSSEAAICGGGRVPQPGEVSLSHNGVLFLDELTEFRRSVLESLRVPLEMGRIRIARAAASSEFPARFLMVTAMNPCPCGYFGADSRRCRCSLTEVRKYLAKLSAPFLERIDIQLELTPVDSALLVSSETPETMGDPAEQVTRCRELQLKRQGKLNSELSMRDFRRMELVSESAYEFVARACTKAGLSSRALVRILRLARTLSDLEGETLIEKAAVVSAMNFRHLDRLWAQFRSY